MALASICFLSSNLLLFSLFFVLFTFFCFLSSICLLIFILLLFSFFFFNSASALALALFSFLLRSSARLRISLIAFRLTESKFSPPSKRLKYLFLFVRFLELLRSFSKDDRYF